MASEQNEVSLRKSPQGPPFYPSRRSMEHRSRSEISIGRETPPLGSMVRAQLPRSEPESGFVASSVLSLPSKFPAFPPAAVSPSASSILPPAYRLPDRAKPYDPFPLAALWDAIDE
ncbi:hypothetical protein KM043_010854 [Ampulex compressa]|nr:hypothetical protein KM043_010854 [Ampulex compressa]